METPYTECPVFETKSFILRLIHPDDAEDLLKCYSDIKTNELFNSDFCSSKFHFQTLDNMSECIVSWLKAYKDEEYIRFSILEKTCNRVVGTVEIFGMVGKYKTPDGILRLDICSEYEKYQILKELFELCITEFFPLFKVKRIITKAIPIAEERIKALSELGFSKIDIPNRKDSWVLEK